MHNDVRMGRQWNSLLMKELAITIPDHPDPIDERFALDPIDEDFTEETLLANTRDLVALLRVEIEEYNKAVAESARTGKKRAGAATKKAQRTRLSAEEQRLIVQAKNDGDMEDLF